MDANEVFVSLRVAHPSADLTPFAKALEMIELRSWKAGDSRTTPKGRPLTGANKESFLVLQFERPPWDSLAEALRSCATDLAARETALRSLPAGSAVELYVTSSPGAVTGNIDAETLRRLGELNVALALDVIP